ncbi:MAG: uracil phosphoribosyltransferase [Acidobacteria bacterium]|nr:uracil phosphoribosyltransferase [Acidobacteriota bacterium]
MPLHILDHPVAQDALMELRDPRTGSVAFRSATTRISLLLATEALREVPTTTGTVATSHGAAEGHVIDSDVVVVPVLRAGLGMLDAVLALVPAARIGHIGLQRNESTAVASTYYAKLPPDIGESFVMVADPMLATGGTAASAIDLIKASGARTICMICIVAAPEGVEVMAQRHPDVALYTPVVDRELSAQKYIVPGVGDFGDRLHGTG